MRRGEGVDGGGSQIKGGRREYTNTNKMRNEQKN